ncbi:hypothetical protein DB32_001454 [Sandaracinus amylolyticus]|uniref:N-acetyltransferase domain-containing protein n=1 Tax=Sandaracinus amylolyticus TaxID=927083 RepID=A0A0F6W0I0_9BACT|nr:hypothetical protein DB32_001454 [Sandaracinus amylolyticus]
MRYRVYVEELGRTQRHADHDRKTIEEPLDRDCMLWAAYDGDQLVGTVRSSYAWRCDLGDYPELYQMARVGRDHPRHTSITTKLLVLRDHRLMSVARALALATYRRGLADGVRHDFIDVYPARIPFFEHLGYRVHVPELQHPEYGRVVVMSLDLHDREHFGRVGSPFLDLSSSDAA